MTIRNYTFFSPNGTEFPVTANSDAKLYMLLAGNDYSQFIIKHWSEPVLTGLNKIYADTSILLGGRYFELNNEPVGLKPNSINYIHANVDPSNINTPVTFSVETANNSNSKDINSGNGVIKRLIDIVTTDATTIIKSEAPEQGRNFNTINSDKGNIKSLTISDSISEPSATTTWKLPYCNDNGSRLTRVGNLVIAEGTFTAGYVKPAGALVSGGSYPVETVPVGYRPWQDKYIAFSLRTSRNGDKVGRVQLLPDGRMSDMFLFNEGFKSTVDAMMFGESAMWITKDPFPTKDKINY